jgi:NADPH:quinone reductase-like Zn-dependent oxidoreductase
VERGDVKPRMGDVKPRMGDVFRLEQAREAQDASQQGRAKGKILLKVA